MSIKRKLTLTMMIISIAAVMLTAVTIATYLIYDMRISKADELRVSAAVTGDRNSAALIFLDTERAQKNLDLLRLDSSILSTCIYDRTGALFAGYRADTAGPENDCPPSPGHTASHGDRLTASHNITDGGEVIGTVYMVSDTRAIEAFVKKLLLVAAITVVLVIGISLPLAIHFQRSISAPILELASTAQSITAKRDYSIEARQDYLDETGSLAKAFNEMLREVRKRDAELTEANETLEQKVLDRTRELEEQKQRAEMASAAKSEFLRNMSHEFRTPLHALISFSAYGIREYESAERSQLKHYFEIMQQGAGRLSRLVGEVLDLAKLEHGEHVFQLARTDMHELTSRAADLVEPLLKEKNIGLKLDCPDNHPLAVCDQDKIVQVITNLLGNAIKFTPTGRNITLRTSTLQGDTGPQVEVDVIDEGLGIPEEEKEVIFESFRQSSRTNNGSGGTGLGLAICRHIIGAHGGRIWAENNAGSAGARFTFVMPATLQEGRKIIHS